MFESARRPNGLGPLIVVICLQLVPLLAWVVPLDVRTPTQPTSSLPECVAVTTQNAR